MRKVLILDTSILCVWLEVPGKESCGSDGDRWDKSRVDEKIRKEEQAKTTFLLPIASIIETGNHIAQASHSRRECAQSLSDVIVLSAQEQSPWAAFSEHTALWSPEKLEQLAKDWPEMANRRMSMGDMTIRNVAELYAQMNYDVEILTADHELKAHEPIPVPSMPRRRQR
ncbi:MAG: hypothetical protein JW764_09800 [Chlorobiaceae bacterium]|nr:hypothetical protein [Chlorobiaceae bacterium]